MLVLDTSAIIKLQRLEGVTVPEAVAEVKNRPSKARIESALSAGHLRIEEPDAESMEKVEAACARLGEKISITDRKLLALALAKSGTLLTDDYSIQNVAAVLGIKAQPVDERGIRKVLSWKMYCTACRKFGEGEECQTCGHGLVRKSVRP